MNYWPLLGIAIVVMSLIIPWGIFTRYVLGEGLEKKQENLAEEVAKTAAAASKAGAAAAVQRPHESAVPGGIAAIPGLYVLGDPHLSIVAFGARLVQLLGGLK